MKACAGGLRDLTGGATARTPVAPLRQCVEDSGAGRRDDPGREAFARAGWDCLTAALGPVGAVSPTMGASRDPVTRSSISTGIGGRSATGEGSAWPKVFPGRGRVTLWFYARASVLSSASDLFRVAGKATERASVTFVSRPELVQRQWPCRACPPAGVAAQAPYDVQRAPV